MADPSILALGAIWFVAFLFSTTLHEAAHAFVAWRLGDPTAYHGGQVTLNPLPHIRREPFGMVVVPILSFLLQGGRWMIGWASAPYDPSWAMRYPRRAGLMALAGPLSNLLIAIVAGIALRVGLATDLFARAERLRFEQLVAAPGSGAAEGLATLLSVLFSLNLLLFLFNLLPLPPMDGAAVLQLLLPASAARRWAELMRQPMIGLLGLLIAWRVFGYLFLPIFGLALALLFAGL
jgi:Zn-dependent protease